MARPTQKIRVVVPDPKNGDAITYNFDSWADVELFAKTKKELSGK